LALGILGFVAWDLAKVGHEHARERGDTGRRGIRHVGHGYRAISEAHRRHIHWTLATVAVVSLAVGVWIAVLAYQSTH